MVEIGGSAESLDGGFSSLNKDTGGYLTHHFPAMPFGDTFSFPACF